jgi:hypothetical protein
MSYVSSQQRRINRAVSQSNTRRVIDWLGSITLASVFGLFFAFIILNWLTGCGERFPTDSVGGYVQGECVTPVDIYRDYRANHSTGDK